MKFQPDRLAGTNVVERIDPRAIWVGEAAHERSLLVPWQGAVLPWRPVSPEGLTVEDFDAVLALNPEVVVFGSGPRLVFLHPSLTRALIDRRIGVETMDTPAACRTFNVLVSEGRRAVAALLFAPQA